MCMGIALPVGELPPEYLSRPEITRRIHERDDEREVRFLHADYAPLLPIRHEGQLLLVRWGNRDRRGKLPPTGWTWLTTVESGRWGPYHAEPVEIPASWAMEKGVWFQVKRASGGWWSRVRDRPRRT